MVKKLDESQYTTLTRLIYGKSMTEAWEYSHHVNTPLTQSATFRLDSASRGAAGFDAVTTKYPDDPEYKAIFVYNRMGEPNASMLEQALAIAEGKDSCVSFSSGMGAISAAILSQISTGQEIVSHKVVYGCTHSLMTSWLTRMGITTHFCNMVDSKSILPLVNDKTRIVYFESPSNPTLELIDIPQVMKIVGEINSQRADNNKIVTIIDNTLATPFSQRPAEYGVDLIVHSLTKGIGGFNTKLGGAVVCDLGLRNSLLSYRKDFGVILSPESAWHIMNYGLPTLGLRFKTQQQNAIKIASYLESHPKVESVIYPGLKSYPQFSLAKKLLRDYEGNFSPGFMIYFTLKAPTPEQSKSMGEKIMDYIADNSYCITLAVSLGHIRTLIEHPGSMTHLSYTAEQQLQAGMHPGGVRLAVGIEPPEDVIRDLEQAFQVI